MSTMMMQPQAVNNNQMALENLFKELYGCRSISNERRNELTHELIRFRSHENSLADSLQIFALSEDFSTKCFCLSVLREKISHGRSSTQQSQFIHDTLWSYLQAKHRHEHSSVINMACDVLVYIAHIELPHVYPDFIGDILRLSENRETILLGLTLLEILIQDTVWPRQCLNRRRADELKQRLLVQCNSIISMMNNFLMMLVTNNAANKVNGINGEALMRPISDPLLVLAANQMLCCTSPLITLVLREPQHRHIVKTLAEIICQLSSSSLPSVIISNKKDWTESTTINEQLSINALSCIEEILDSKHFSNENILLYDQTIQHTFHFMQALLVEDGNQKILVNCLPSNFGKKLAQICELIMREHFGRLMNASVFPFLELIFRMTFKIDSTENFLLFTDVWNAFIERISTTVITSNGVFDGNRQLENVKKFKEVLVALVSELIVKVQYKFNQENLEDLEPDYEEGVGGGNYTRRCIVTIGKVCELLPAEVNERVMTLFNENLQNFMALDRCLLKVGDEIRLEVEIDDIRHVHSSLNDLSVALKMLAQNAVDLYGGKFDERYNFAEFIVKTLISMLQLLNRNNLLTVNTCDPKLSKDLVMVFRQLMVTLRAFGPWFEQIYHIQGPNEHSNRGILLPILDEFVFIIVSPVSPQWLVKEAAKELYRITAKLGACLPIADIPSLGSLFEKLCSSLPDYIVNGVGYEAREDVVDDDFYKVTIEDRFEQLIDELKISLCCTFANMCLTSLHGVDRYHKFMGTRQQYFKHLFNEIAEPLVSVLSDKPVGNQISTDFIVQRSVPLFTAILYSNRHAISDLKLAISEQFLSVLSKLLDTNKINLTTRIVVLEFMYACWEMFRTQVSNDDAKMLSEIDSMLDDRGNLFQLQMSESDSIKCTKYICDLLALIIVSPYSQVRSVLPKLVNVMRTKLYQLVEAMKVSGLSLMYFQLVHNLLLNCSRYFCCINDGCQILGIRLSVTNENWSQWNAAHYGADCELRLSQFIFFTQLCIEWLSAKDHRVEKFLFKSLGELNSQIRLFEREAFKKFSLEKFIMALLNACLNTGNADDLGELIFSLAAVDFSHFYKTAIVNFLKSVDTLSQQQRQCLIDDHFLAQDTDQPTFVRKLDAFFNDIFYYTRTNSLSTC